jgi:hypothetical protein
MKAYKRRYLRRLGEILSIENKKDTSAIKIG